MAETLPEAVTSLIEKAFNEKIENFTVTIHEGNKKGVGFLGDIIFISLNNKKTNEDHHVLIKQVLPSEKDDTIDLMSTFYDNEICLYTKILPALQDFQKSFPEVEIFDNFPKCFATLTERGKEKVLLENVKFKNYEVYPKKLSVSSKMYEEIFKLYGKYHALSFAFKELHPEEFSKLASLLKPNWEAFADSPILSPGIDYSGKSVKDILEKHNETELIKRAEKYVDKCSDIFRGAIQYKGPYGIITHGDCHSLNMMFKYTDSGEIEDIKLIDFQLAYLGSPVYDLSYSLYSGARREVYDNFDSLLKIYHKSLDDNLRQYGLSAEKIYPFKILKEEWKEYCPFGYVMGHILWSTKCMEEVPIPDLNKIMDGDVKTSDDSIDYSVYMDKEKYEAVVYELVKHMGENDFL